MRTSFYLSLKTAALVLVFAACAGDTDRASIAGPQFNEEDDPCEGGQCVECREAPPLSADAGLDQEVQPGSLVTLSGSAAGAGSDAPIWCTGIVAVTWEQTDGPAVTLSDVHSLSPTFTAPSAATVLTFRLTATNVIWGTASDEVSITVLMSIPDQFTNLIALVNGAGLEKNTAKSLVSLLQNAAAGYAKGDIDGTLDKLNSFIAQVSALKKKIPQQGELIDAANALIAAIAEETPVPK